MMKLEKIHTSQQHIVGPITLPPIILYHEPNALYAQLNENPKI